jgi:predicted solute-binding protein
VSNVTRKLERNHLKLVSQNGQAVNLDQQAIANKQIAATVRIKRIAFAHEHVNAALTYLREIPSESRSKEATEAANAFIEHYFANATTNVIDLTSEAAEEALAFAVQVEAAQARKP